MSGIGLAAGAVVTAAGAAAKGAASKTANDQQSAATQVANAKQAGLETQASDDVGGAAARAAAANPNAGKNQLLAAYSSALSGGNPQVSAGLPSVPGASKRYQASVASGKANVADYARTMANDMATTGGAQLQRIATGNDIADQASNLGLLQGQSTNAANALKTKLAGIQVNPWLTAGGSVLQGVGQGMMSSGLSSGLGSMGGSSTGGDFSGVDPTTGVANAPTFAGGSVTPGYSTGFNSAVAKPVSGFSNPFL